MKFLRRYFLSAAALVTLMHCGPIAFAKPAQPAPFTNEQALREFSNALIGEIGRTNLDSAESSARKNSHLDDEITQQNLNDVFVVLKRLLNEPHIMESRFVQQSKFGRSFIRYQYSLSNAQLSIRCMLTYRRKTEGWRLNQLWCS